MSAARDQLSERSALESEFRFDGSALARLSDQDLHAVEQLVERWNHLNGEQQLRLTATVLPPLCKKLQVEEPPIDSGQRFLEDLLAAEIRRQRRGLG